MGKKVLGKIEKKGMGMVVEMGVMKKKVGEKIWEEVSEGFGGKLYEIMMGGGGLKKEVEKLVDRMGLRYRVGYGGRECGGMMCYEE